jgi:hypothetical protein
MNLYKASNQWATRPDDERFSSLTEMLQSCQYYRHSAVSGTVAYADLTAVAVDGEVKVSGANHNARLTNWAFGQLATIAKAPAGYLRKLPAQLACDNLNHTLPNTDGTGKLLMHQNGDLMLRCITSEDYTRIWNTDVIERLIDLQGEGWRVPPARPARDGQRGTRPATEADVLNATGFGLSVNLGDMIAPAGLYGSDHDMFVFMVNEARRIEDGSEGGLSRGFFVSNSEVGGGALNLLAFYYRHVCGNHIVWDASNLTRTKIIHRGKANEKFDGEFLVELQKYADDSASEDELRIVSAQRKVIAADKDSVIDALFGKRILPKKSLIAAFDYAEQEETTVAPNTVWGFVQGITRLSQDSLYADERATMDRAAGKVLELAF